MCSRGLSPANAPLASLRVRVSSSYRGLHPAALGPPKDFGLPQSPFQRPPSRSSRGLVRQHMFSPLQSLCPYGDPGGRGRWRGASGAAEGGDLVGSSWDPAGQRRPCWRLPVRLRVGFEKTPANWGLKKKAVRGVHGPVSSEPRGAPGRPTNGR